MSDIPGIQSINYFSEQIQKDGPIILFQYLLNLGAKFKKFGCDDYIDPTQLSLLKDTNRIRYRFELKNKEYSLSLLVELGQLILFGFISNVDPLENKKSAEVLFNLVEKIVPLFSFKYGYFDVEGWDEPSDKTINSIKLTTIFWANFFGRPFVEKYGKEFLLSAPGWKKTELSGGTIEYILTESLFTPLDPLIEKDIKEYFAPKAKIKRFKPGSIDY